MSQLIAVAVHDSAAGVFNRPFFVPSVGLANRSFRDEVNRKATDNPMNQHPYDFTLFHVGFFEDSDGSLQSLPKPVVLARAQDVLE